MTLLHASTYKVVFIYIRYHLEIIKEYGSIQTALLNLKVKYPEIKAILMGTRSTDPHSGKSIFNKYYSQLYHRFIIGIFSY